MARVAPGASAIRIPLSLGGLFRCFYKNLIPSGDAAAASPDILSTSPYLLVSKIVSRAAPVAESVLHTKRCVRL